MVASLRMKTELQQNVRQAQVNHRPDSSYHYKLQEPFQFFGFAAAETDADTLNNSYAWGRCKRQRIGHRVNFLMVVQAHDGSHVYQESISRPLDQPVLQAAKISCSHKPHQKACELS